MIPVDACVARYARRVGGRRRAGENSYTSRRKTPNDWYTDNHGAGHTSLIGFSSTRRGGARTDRSATMTAARAISAAIPFDTRARLCRRKATIISQASSSTQQFALTNWAARRFRPRLSAQPAAAVSRAKVHDQPPPPIPYPGPTESPLPMRCISNTPAPRLRRGPQQASRTPPNQRARFPSGTAATATIKATPAIFWVSPNSVLTNAFMTPPPATGG